MIAIPGKLEKLTVYYDILPEQEYDAKGIPLGIQPDYDRPYLDTQGNTRYVYLYTPASLKPMLLTRSIIAVTDAITEEDIREIMADSGLMELAEREAAFVIFPLAAAGGWNITRSADGPDDVDILNQVQLAARNWFLFTGREKCHEYVMSMVGVGKGATMADIAAAWHPEHVHSVLLFGSRANREDMPAVAEDSEMFVWTVNPEGTGREFWKEANDLQGVQPVAFGRTESWIDPANRAKQVKVTKIAASGFDGGMLLRFWQEACRSNVRIPGVGNGKVFSAAQIFEEKRPCIHIDDRCLGDNGAWPHTWFEFVPESVRSHFADPDYRCPLIIEMHGGGSWPWTSSAKVQFQELGEKEGFITVYANASNVNSWNSVFRTDRPNDVEYITRLIEYLKSRYPVDPTRVYISGFSNGSGMSMVMAALRPDLIAGAICFNTRFPAKEDLYRLAEGVKAKYDYRMPVFYNYGTKDFEFPMKPGCGQFATMNFWKWYNNIPQKPLDPADPSGVGCAGDRVVTWGNFGKNGEPIFTSHCYNSADAWPKNYYNYTLVEGLPHTVERRLIPQAWAFISQFARMEDGSLRFEERKDSLL